MNEYGFDYMNYITNVPGNFTYSNMPNPQHMSNSQLNYIPNNSAQVKMMNTPQLLDPTQGLIRGNLFANLYDPYKNYKPVMLNPENEKEALLYQVMQYKFSLTDLNLYLDMHPNDQEVIALYNKYLAIEKQMCDKYEKMYGPLTLDSNFLGTNSWNWKNSPWPWEGM